MAVFFIVRATTFAVAVVYVNANARRVSVAAESQPATRRAAGVFRVTAVSVTFRSGFWPAVATASRPANGIQIGLFVQKPSAITTSHIKLYVTYIKFVKMLESLGNVYYNVRIKGGKSQ